MTGVLRDTSGRPVAGATVLLAVELSTAEQAVNVMKALSSVGILCVTGCSEPHEVGYTARDGSFAIAVPANNPQHDAYSLTVAVARGNARVATSLSLPRSTRHGRRVGAVVVAAASPAVRTRSDRAHVVPPSLPASYHAGQYAAFLNTETGDPPVIAGSQLTVTGGYDPLVEEDEQLLLTTTQTGVQGGRHAIFSSSLQTRNPMLVPVSRHAACYVEGSHGQAIEQHPCGLTDGLLDTPWSPQDDPRCSRGPCPGHRQHDHRDVTITFASAIRAQLLVVRGCTGCRALVSSDGRHFATAAIQPFGSGDDVLEQHLPGSRVRAVRIETATGGFFSSLREVSLWSTVQIRR